MSYVLTRVVLGCKDRVPITDEEYGEIRRAKEGIVEVVALEEKYDSLMGNYRDLEVALVSMAVDGLVSRDWSWSSFMDQRVYVGRLVGNLLSSSRMYVDHLGHHLSGLFGPGTDDAKKGKVWASEEYDTCFAYRFMEAHRNYSQHRGHPVHRLSHRVRDREAGGGTHKEFSVHPIVDLEELRSDAGFKQAIMQEIDEQKPVTIDKNGGVDLKPLIRDYIEAFSRIHGRVRELVKALIETWEPILVDAIQRFLRDTDTEQTIGLAAAQVHEQGYLQDIVYVLEDLVERLHMFGRRNPAPTKLSRFIASGRL